MSCLVITSCFSLEDYKIPESIGSGLIFLGLILHARVSWGQITGKFFPRNDVGVLLISCLMFCVFFPSKQDLHISTMENCQLVTGCKLPAVKKVIRSQMMALSSRKVMKLKLGAYQTLILCYIGYYTNCSTRDVLPRMSSI